MTRAFSAVTVVVFSAALVATGTHGIGTEGPKPTGTQRSNSPRTTLPSHPPNLSRVAVEGRPNPLLIPEEIAYRTFFRTLARLRNAGNAKRFNGYVNYALRTGVAIRRNGTAPTGEALLVDTSALPGQRRNLMRMVAAFPSVDDLVAEDPQFLQMRSDLVKWLGQDGASAIDHFVLQHVRRNIKIVY